MKLVIKTKQKNYPIYIGKNNSYRISKILKNNNIRSKNIIIICDKNVPSKIVLKIKNNLKSKKVIFFKMVFNEKNKNMKTIEKIINLLQRNNFSRNDCLISIGGGIAGDVCGFASSIYKRGLKFINIPSTLLSQVDSSIGGKTGVNTFIGKNMVGTFCQPDLVISDSIFLKSLPKREIICGYSEILKHSLIDNKSFFYYLKKNYINIINLKQKFLDKAIFVSCKIKKKIVEKDETEKNLRKTLNFGHTFAHAFEATMGYSKKLNHGEAVLLGILAASKFSYKENLLNSQDFNLIEDHLTQLNYSNFKKYFNKNKISKIIKFMSTDKKNKGSSINLVLLKRISKVILHKEYSKKTISNFLKKLIN